MVTCYQQPYQVGYSAVTRKNHIHRAAEIEPRGMRGMGIPMGIHGIPDFLVT